MVAVTALLSLKLVNLNFVDQNYDEAIKFYTQAIEINPNVAAYYGNRSFAYIKTECFGYALEDANKALQLDRAFLKVRTRLKMFASKVVSHLKDNLTVCVGTIIQDSLNYSL